MADFGDVVKFIFSGLQVVGTSAAGAVCGPPCAVAATGAFQLGGQAINAFLEGGNGGGNEQSNNDQAFNDYFQHSLDSLAGIDGTVTGNQEMLRELQSMLSRTSEELGGINGTVLENQEMLKKLQLALNRTAEETQDMLRDIQQRFNGINGSIIQNQELLKELKIMLKATSDENRKTLRDIQVNLKTFEENMNQNFEELKLFMVEREFTVNIRSQMDLLWMLMNDVINSPSKYTVEKFTKKFDDRTPLEILEEFVNGLQHSNMNPITSAMEHHPLKSRSIMESYMHLFSHMAFRVLAMEGFYQGVSKRASVHKLEGVSQDVDKAISTFRDFVVSYKLKTELYWPEPIKKAITSINNNPDIVTVADQMKQKLDGILTADVFSVYVYSRTLSYSTQADPVPLMEMFIENATLKEQRSSRFMVTYVDKHRLAVVLRSEKFHQIPPQMTSLVRASFQSYAKIISGMNTDCDTQYNPNSMLRLAITDRFYEILKDFYEPNPVIGFTAFNVTPEVRFTNNGSSILTEDDLSITPMYYGLSWA